MIVVNVAVIGMGLIGGSLLRALAAAGHFVTGYDLDPSTRAMARTGAAQAPPSARWQVCASIPDAVTNADLAVIATPLTAAASVLDQLAGTGFSGLVTDVVSVKEPMRELVARRLHGQVSHPRFRPSGEGLRLAGYVGGHPMAGKETAGFAATDPSLFTGCAWVLCLEEETNLDDWLTLARLITSLQARVVPTTAEDHDRVVAAVSHVPHLLAVALASAIGDPLASTLAAGSFRDGTRVAATAPDLVRAMCEANADQLLPVLDQALERLHHARELLAGHQPLTDFVDQGHAARVRYDSFTRPDIVTTVVGAPGWREELAAAGRAGGVIRSALPVLGTRE